MYELADDAVDNAGESSDRTEVEGEDGREEPFVVLLDEDEVGARDAAAPRRATLTCSGGTCHVARCGNHIESIVGKESQDQYLARE